jgi:hypothetical protein
MRCIALIGLMYVVGAGAPAQVFAQSRTQARSAAAALDCKACHTAATPTKANPALAACPRLLVKGYHQVGEAPETMVLGDSAGKYGPVRFSHRDHARMAETGKGCNGCHHYDQARSIQQCKACHSTARLRTDLAKPDVQAAMHRQCLECHRDWSPASKCGSCHQQSGVNAAGGVAQAAAKAPKPVAPARIVYETKAVEGKTVTFFHDDHTQRFGLQCAECHQQQTCAACHSVKELARAPVTVAARPARKNVSAADAHARCSACHANDACATCHTNTGARTAGFNHKAQAGWALNRFHAPLTCQQCHTTPGKFAKLNADCESCHKGWQVKFDHKKTGLALDEVHAGADCAGCHEDKQFLAAPACGSCHTDKSWPANKPGKVVAKVPGTPATRR